MSVIDIARLCLYAEASLLRHRAEDMIPEWGGYAIGSIWLLVMMQCMMYPKHLHEILRRWKSVYGIMHTQVCGVTGYKTTSKWNTVFAEE